MVLLMESGEDCVRWSMPNAWYGLFAYLPASPAMAEDAENIQHDMLDFSQPVLHLSLPPTSPLQKHLISGHAMHVTPLG